MSERKERREFYWEILVYGFREGVLLLTVGLFYLWVLGDMAGSAWIMKRFGVVLLVYCMAGVLLELVRRQSEKGIKWFRGLAAFCICDILLFAFIALNGLLPGFIHSIILADFVVFFGLRAANYFYMKNIAMQLNDGKKGWTLVVDLKEKPRTKEEFFSVLEEYCFSNHMDLEYVNRDLPATVRLDGKLHRIELNYYYSYGGPVYTMDIIQI